MAEGIPVLPRGQSRHIELNAGNVFAVGLLSVLFYGTASWTSAWLARTDIPLVNKMALGAHYYLHGAG